MNPKEIIENKKFMQSCKDVAFREWLNSCKILNKTIEDYQILFKNCKSAATLRDAGLQLIRLINSDRLNELKKD